MAPDRVCSAASLAASLVARRELPAACRQADELRATRRASRVRALPESSAASCASASILRAGERSVRDGLSPESLQYEYGHIIWPRTCAQHDPPVANERIRTSRSALGSGRAIGTGHGPRRGSAASLLSLLAVAVGRRRQKCSRRDRVALVSSLYHPKLASHLWARARYSTCNTRSCPATRDTFRHSTRCRVILSTITKSKDINSVTITGE